jgi:hypothetical protein
LVVVVSLVAAAASAQPSAPPMDPAVKAAGIGDTIAPFSAEVITVAGETKKTAPFDSRKTGKLTAYIVVGTRCPTTAAYIERFKQIEQAYAKKGVDFIYVYPNREDTPEAKLAFHKEHQFHGRLIDDQGGRVARALQAQRTSELILVDKTGTILFRGAVDDNKDPNAVQRRYVTTALDEHLAGKPVTTPVSQVFA